MSVLFVVQAYTSQFVALIMFGLMMSEDRLSLQKRRLEIIGGLKVLPGQSYITNKWPWIKQNWTTTKSNPFFSSSSHIFLLLLVELIKKVLSLDDKIKAIANEMYQQRSLLVMGRGFNYATCLEGALVSGSHSVFLCKYLFYFIYQWISVYIII